MQFSTLLATAVALTAASAASIQNTVKFTAESKNTEVNNQGLASLHEGAAVNYIFLGDGGSETFDYDSKTDVISKTVTIADDQQIQEYFTVLQGAGFPTLQVSASNTDHTKWTIEDGYLKGNGSDNFYAAKNTKDPYRYSSSGGYQVGLFQEGASTSEYTDVVPIKIKATIEGKN